MELCIDFLKVDPSWDGKENILVLTGAFSKFSQAFVTPNQKELTVTKVLVDKWFMFMPYLLEYTVIKATVLKMIFWPSCTQCVA